MSDSSSAFEQRVVHSKIEVDAIRMKEEFARAYGGDTKCTLRLSLYDPTTKKFVMHHKVSLDDLAELKKSVLQIYSQVLSRLRVREQLAKSVLPSSFAKTAAGGTNMEKMISSTPLPASSSSSSIPSSSSSAAAPPSPPPATELDSKYCLGCGKATKKVCFFCHTRPAADGHTHKRRICMYCVINEVNYDIPVHRCVATMAERRKVLDFFKR